MACTSESEIKESKHHLQNQKKDVQITQITKYATQLFDSTFQWKLDNFASFPDATYYTEKIDIVGTKFYWVFQMKTVGGSACTEAKFILSHHGKKYNEDDLKYSSCEFVAKIGETVVWKQSILQMSPMIISTLATKHQGGSTSVNATGFLKDNRCLKINITVKIKTTRLLKDVTIVSKNLMEKLSDDFKCALECDDLKDVTFMVEDKVVKAHKAILGARSPVFKNMFMSNMREMKENVVEVTDIKLDTFQEMLHFIYVGSFTENFTIVVLELLEAAHKYQIESLIKACENEMHRSLTEENAAAIHGICTLYDVDESLKNDAFKMLKSQICSQIEKCEFGNDEEQKKFLSQLFNQSFLLPYKLPKKNNGVENEPNLSELFQE